MWDSWLEVAPTRISISFFYFPLLIIILPLLWA
jgi:hypothetical protein